MVVSVRSASGLPMGDPISRKCQPYVILTVVEVSKQVRLTLCPVSLLFQGSKGWSMCLAEIGRYG